jgi:hypothetical protein
MISPLSMPWRWTLVIPRLLCPELALDDDQRDAFAGHLDGVGVPELMWREASLHSRRRRGTPQLGAHRGLRPVPSARRAVDRVQQRTDRKLAAQLKPGL